GKRVALPPGLGRGAAGDRKARSAARWPLDRRRAARRTRADPPVLVRAVLRAGPRRARARAAGDHLVQSQLAEPDGPRRRRLSREPGGGRRVGAPRVHGAAERARHRLEARALRGVSAIAPKVPLSVLVITLNEAHNLPDCLASVAF